MKKTYPDYKKNNWNGGVITKIKDKLSPADKKILNDFLEYCSISCNIKKNKDIETIMLQIYDIIEKQYSKITLEDIRGFLSLLNNSDRRVWTQNGIKVIFKKFLRWKYKDWSSRFDGLKDIKNKTPSNEEKVNASTLIKPEELEKILRAATSLRDKALLMIFWETGARPQEIRNLKWEDIKFLEKYGTIQIFSEKTKTSRTVPIKEAVLHIKRWMNEYSFPNRSDKDYIFPSKEDRKKPIGDTNAWYTISRLGDKAGLSRRLYGYLFRHTKGTEFYTKLPIEDAKKIMGHSKMSNMHGVYTHRNNESAIKEMLEKIYHVEEPTPEQKLKIEKELDEIKKQFEDFKAGVLRDLKKQTRKEVKLQLGEN